MPLLLAALQILAIRDNRSSHLRDRGHTLFADTQRPDFETFFSEAPALHPHASKITGVICGVRIEEIEDPLMQKIRYVDKLVDELAKGRPMTKILRPWHLHAAANSAFPPLIP